MRHLLAYTTAAVLWLIALRREAARIRHLEWVDRWCKEFEHFAARFVVGVQQTGSAFAEASDRISEASLGWVQVNTRVPTSSIPPRMTSSGDATQGMTLDELLGRVDDVLEDSR